LSVHNYVDSSTKFLFCSNYFSDLYLVKILDLSAKQFFSCTKTISVIHPFCFSKRIYFKIIKKSKINKAYPFC